MIPTCNDPGALALFWLRPESLSAHCDWVLRQAAAETRVSTSAYLKAFAITNLLEAPFYLTLLRGKPFWLRCLGLLAANFLTHPFVYFLMPYLFARGGHSYATFLAIAEGFAMTAETLFIYLLFRTRLTETVALVFCANLFSWWVGLFV